MDNSTKFHKLRDAINHALANYENTNGKKGKQVQRGQALKKIANRLIHMAINANDTASLATIKELGDRLDGKAAQAITGFEGEPITIVQRVIVQQVAPKEIDITPPVEGDKPKTIN